MTSLFPNWVKRAQGLVCLVSIVMKRSKKIFDETLKWGFCFRYHFLKIYNFISRGDVINPKLGQKWPWLLFHVQIVIERWKSTVKENLRWGFHFWKQSIKILKFWLPPTSLAQSSTQKWIKKVQIGISFTNIDRKMKIKTKRYFDRSNDYS